MALIITTKKAAALQLLLDKLRYRDRKAIRLYKDNVPVINLIKRPITDGRFKHIEIRWYWIKQAVKKGVVAVEWIRTEDQAADGLIKALNFIKYARFVQQLGLVDCAEAIRKLIGAIEATGKSSAGTGHSIGTSDSAGKAVSDSAGKAVNTE